MPGNEHDSHRTIFCNCITNCLTEISMSLYRCKGLKSPASMILPVFYGTLLGDMVYVESSW
eukprot:2154101-Rhodomonas_salina.2